MIPGIQSKPIHRCPQCGTDVLSGAVICKHCGTSLSKETIRTENTRQEDFILGGLGILIITIAIQFCIANFSSSGFDLDSAHDLCIVVSLSAFIIAAGCCYLRRLYPLCILSLTVGILFGLPSIVGLFNLVTMFILYRNKEGFIE